MKQVWVSMLNTINKKQNEANSTLIQLITQIPQSKLFKDNVQNQQEQMPLKSNQLTVREKKSQQFSNSKIRSTFRRKKKILGRIEGNQKIKTQPAYSIQKKSKNFNQRASKASVNHKEILQQRNQLKIIYQRKLKLQQKLKRLNIQLQKLTKERQRNNHRYQYKNQSKQSKSIGNVSLVNSRITKINKLQGQSQLQKSRKAVQFVQKMNNQSRTRKKKYYKRLNQSKIQKTLKHVCIECSRAKCRGEVFQGQLLLNYK